MRTARLQLSSNHTPLLWPGMPDQRVAAFPSLAFSGVSAWKDSEAPAMASRARFGDSACSAAGVVPSMTNTKGIMRTAIFPDLFIGFDLLDLDGEPLGGDGE